MPLKFILDLWYENDCDRSFAEEESNKLIKLIHEIALNVVLEVEVRKAVNIIRMPNSDVPIHEPISTDHQSLLISNEYVDRQGFAGPVMGCLSKQRMKDKINRHGNSANITIHEWLHTLCGKEINGRIIPFVDDNKKMVFLAQVEKI